MERKLTKCSKSKVSKRAVPANEALSRILQMDIKKAIDRVIEKRPEIVEKELTILLAGDSTCTMLPRSNIQLIWIESEEN